MDKNKEFDIKENTTVILITEGIEDKRFFEKFLYSLNLNLTNYQIMPIGGKTKFRENIKALVNKSGFHQILSIGIIRDADENPDTAFQSVCDALVNAGLQKPEEQTKPIISKPKITVMILPSSKEKGALESLCLDSKINDPAIPCLEQYFDCLKEKGFTEKYNTAQYAKAKVHAFLASRDDPTKETWGSCGG